MLDCVACLRPSGGDGSEKCEYLIDRFKAEVESSYVLIGAFEIYNVFWGSRNAHFHVRRERFQLY